MHSDSLDPAHTQPRVDTHLKDADNSYYATNCHWRALPSNVRFATWRQMGAAPFATWRLPGVMWRHVANALFRINVDTFTAWRHFGAMWRCEHNFTYHCTSPRGGVATWRQKMANLKFPFAILAPRGATWRHKFAKMAPLWRQNGAIVAIQRTRHFMAPRGAKCSPRGATVAPRGATKCARPKVLYYRRFKLLFLVE